MLERDYQSNSGPRSQNGESPRTVYVATNRYPLTETLIAGEVLRNHGVPVVAEGHGFAVAVAYRGQVEEALGHINTGRGFRDVEEGSPLQV